MLSAILEVNVRCTGCQLGYLGLEKPGSRGRSLVFVDESSVKSRSHWIQKISSGSRCSNEPDAKSGSRRK